MKVIQSVRAHSAKVASAATGLLVSVHSFAQTADPFTTAMTDATAKVGEYAAALVGLSAVAVAFMIGMKYVKRIPRAS